MNLLIAILIAGLGLLILIWALVPFAPIVGTSPGTLTARTATAGRFGACAPTRSAISEKLPLFDNTCKE